MQPARARIRAVVRRGLARCRGMSTGAVERDMQHQLLAAAGQEYGARSLLCAVLACAYW